jgi:hypothetical protein
MKTNHRVSVTISVLALILVAGCQQVVRVAPKRAEGASGFKFVEGSLGQLRHPPVEDLAALVPGTPGTPIEIKLKANPIRPLATPAYPPALLGRVRLPVAVGVHITVDETGRVAHVGPSLVAFSTGGEWAGEFREAVEAALAQWRFRPAEIRGIVQKQEESGRGSYWLTLSKRPVDDAFDVAFTFTATGEVVTEAPK